MSMTEELLVRVLGPEERVVGVVGVVGVAGERFDGMMKVNWRVN